MASALCSSEYAKRRVVFTCHGYQSLLVRRNDVHPWSILYELGKLACGEGDLVRCT